MNEIYFYFLYLINKIIFSQETNVNISQNKPSKRMRKMFTLVASLLAINSFTFGQTTATSNELADAKIVQPVNPNTWAEKGNYIPFEEEKVKPRAANFIYYAFAIAEPNLTMDEYLDGSVVSESNSYMIAYSNHPMIDIFATLLQKPALYIDIADNAKESMKKEIGILYKNTNIKPVDAQKLILNQLTNIYNLRVQPVQKMKEVWTLKITDSQKFAIWTHTGTLTVTETEPSSINMDDKGFYKGMGNTVEVLAEGLQKYCNEPFVAEPSIKAQINIEKLAIKDMNILAQTLLEKYGITMKKTKKLMSVIEISSK
jgi:hypothetical protein